ncbi:hypothetical protein [Streptomyces sp. NPDC015345]|uniref:hypothetical protein n=1 Tax=Streptomyces sp. NPDC015345 TaxID=3364953 RepID=UPI0036FEB8F8
MVLVTTAGRSPLSIGSCGRDSPHLRALSAVIVNKALSLAVVLVALARRLAAVPAAGEPEERPMSSGRRNPAPPSPIIPPSTRWLLQPRTPQVPSARAGRDEGAGPCS